MKLDKVPPNNIDAENAVLGAMLTPDENIAPVVLPLLTKEDFYKFGNACIFEAIATLFGADAKIDLLTVTEQLERNGMLDRAGGVAAIDQMIDAIPSVANVEAYAEMVKKESTRRQLIMATAKGYNQAFDDELEFDDVIAETEKAILDIRIGKIQNSVSPISTVFKSTIDRLQEIAKNPDGLLGIATGFHELDTCIQGIQKGDLTVIAGRPGMGKCLSGDAVMIDGDSGCRVTAREFYENRIQSTLSLDASNGVIIPAKVTNHIFSGCQVVYNIVTVKGAKVAVTKEHLLLTPLGWRKAKSLISGESYIAVAATMPDYSCTQSLTDKEALSVTESRASSYNFMVDDVCFELVKSLERAGEVDTYDFSIPIYSNFIANDIIVHNSILAQQIAVNAARHCEESTLLFSLEMPEEALGMRIASSVAGVPFEHIRRAYLTDKEWSDIIGVFNEMDRVPLSIDDTPGITVEEIRSRCHQEMAKNGLGVVVVDYFQLIGSNNKQFDKLDRLEHISESMKNLARSLNVAVVLVAQLNRNVESRPDKRPQLSDIKSCGKLEADSDVVMFIYREAYYSKDSSDHSAELIIGKQRNGELKVVPLRFDGARVRFIND